MAAKGAGEKDGEYFLKLAKAECDRLMTMANTADNDLKNLNLSEENKGKLRVASGKAKLLTTKKMEQFKQLCIKNIDKNHGDYQPVTNNDLEAYWDIFMIQVNDLDELFGEIEQLRANNWKKETGKGMQQPGPSKPRRDPPGKDPKGRTSWP
ncbi:unnamed protein product [Ceutorhynchus assimilis]|uniref:Uncharacterized protein n=1 Tax=Ceutorhynchus assimilis TaxID=467358 RepID=A0A9N9QJY1_9CUCU|nr:unnamed protein product [Ceutorhynchus assimilis]